MLKLGPRIKRSDMPEVLYPVFTTPQTLDNVAPIPTELTFKAGIKIITVTGKLYSRAWFEGTNSHHESVIYSGITGGKEIDISKAIVLPFGWENDDNGGGIAFLPDEDFTFEPGFESSECVPWPSEITLNVMVN